MTQPDPWPLRYYEVNAYLKNHLTFNVLRRSTIQLLRFHFSLFLLPVYLFALSQLDQIDPVDAIVVFFILHVLVYPSSNGYNSYMDRDETPIGGLSKPLQPTRQLLYATIIMDCVAIGLSLFISIYFATGVLLYILASRAYSYRGIRLKKFPLTGYLVVVIFQGAVAFFLSYHGSGVDKPLQVPFWPALASSLLIGGYYPLTQIYQHSEDLEDGVVTISYKLGKKGTFVFCGIVFALATAAMFFTFDERGQLQLFFIFAVCMLPMILFFMQWMIKTWKDQTKADFKNSLRMNLLASGCTTICFLILIILKGFE